MGTHGGAVDYLTTKKIREGTMGWTSTHASDLDLHITGYGYADEERQKLTTLTPDQNQGRGWVDALTWTPSQINHTNANPANQGSIELHLTANRAGNTSIQIRYPRSEKLLRAKIYDLHGKSIKEFDLNAVAQTPISLSWDGKNESDVSLSSGTYLFCLEGVCFKNSKQFRIVR